MKEHICDYCQQPYTAYNPNQKHCKPSHRVAMSKLRKRLKEAETARRRE